MKKEGFRLSVVHRDYDPNTAGALRNDLEATITRLLPAKNLREEIKDATEANGRIVDAELDATEAAANAAHDAAQQTLTDQADAARAAWGMLAHAAQIAAGGQPPLHIVAVFVPPVRQPRVREARINALRDASVADQLITLFGTGASLVEIYETAPNALARTKIEAGHRAAMRAAEAALRTAVRGRTAVQAHPLITVVVVDTVLEYWRVEVQGYTPDQLAAANIAAVEATLLRPITVTAAPDELVQHCDAFGAVNAPGAAGFEERLVTSVMRACEPLLRGHLEQTVPRDELVRQARTGSAAFVRFLVSQAKLAQAKATAQIAANTVAALEVQIASLRADHGRMELQLREQGQRGQGQQPPAHAQRGRQQGRQVVGSPAYTGCDVTLPNGRVCGDMGHNRRNHPRT